MRKFLPFLVLFFSLAAVFHYKSIYQEPMSSYVWAQADHYALALGFIDNGFDFFHPKTYALNHQYPPLKALDNPQGITAVDFPLLHYLVAMGYKLTGRTAPLIFRLISMIFSFIGLAFFYKALYDIRGKIVALSLSAFILLQPCYVFYQDGFHVCAAAFGVFLVGFSFVLRHIYLQHNIRYLALGVGLLSLAALMRFIQIIPLIALLSIFVLKWFENKTWNRGVVLCCGGLFVVLVYFFYNKLLADKYGSIFINYPLPAESFSAIIYYALTIVKMYAKFFLPPSHLLFLCTLIVLFIKQKKWKSCNMFLIGWIGITALGSLLFSVLMIVNVSIHDYYSIDVWLPVLTMLLVFLAINVSVEKLFIKKGLVYSVFLFISSVVLCLYVQNKRYNPELINVFSGGDDDRFAAFRESADYLEENIPVDNKVLIICETGWNIPQIGWRRDVYRIGGRDLEGFSDIVSQKYDAIVTYNKTFEENVVKQHPYFLSLVEKVDTNGKVTIWKQH